LQSIYSTGSYAIGAAPGRQKTPDFSSPAGGEAVAREVEEAAYRTGVARRERAHTDSIM